MWSAIHDTTVVVKQEPLATYVMHLLMYGVCNWPLYSQLRSYILSVATILEETEANQPHLCMYTQYVASGSDSFFE